jgi:hypothetical protein
VSRTRSWSWSLPLLTHSRPLKSTGRYVDMLLQCHYKSC